MMMTTTRRDRNVYILGAGFSAAAGIPVVRDFIDRVRLYFDDPAAGMSDSEQLYFQRFLNFKRRMSQAREKVQIDLDNIEHLFGLVEISSRLGREPVETRVSTVNVIAKTLELSTRSKRTDRISFAVDRKLLDQGANLPPSYQRLDGYPEAHYAADMYDHFASLASGRLDAPERRFSRMDTIITFNYDLLLDHALRRIGVEPRYGLSHAKGVVNSGEAPECTLLKLHGSTNWTVCANSSCGLEVVVLNQKATALSDRLGSRVCTKCKRKGFQPLLIPPSWDKSEYREIMQPVWSKAVEALSVASRICIIGYSMPEADSFFKYLLTLALSENHNLYKLIVVDIDPGISGKYENLLDPLFRNRRFSPFVEPMGLASFLATGQSYADIGRGELIGGNVSRM
jgi:hypothetical protein